jgi:hypothetical protein
LKGSDLFNINGLVLMTLYVTLTIVSLLPWQCVSNPNGTLTMQTQPGVICFNSEEHTMLMLLSVLGIIMHIGWFQKVSSHQRERFLVNHIHGDGVTVGAVAVVFPIHSHVPLSFSILFLTYCFPVPPPKCRLSLASRYPLPMLAISIQATVTRTANGPLVPEDNKPTISGA